MFWLGGLFLFQIPMFPKILSPKREATLRGSERKYLSCLSFKTTFRFVPALQVKLYKSENLDNPIQTVSLGQSLFFHFPPLLRDDQVTSALLSGSCLCFTNSTFQPREAVLSLSACHCFAAVGPMFCESGEDGLCGD